MLGRSVAGFHMRVLMQLEPSCKCISQGQKIVSDTKAYVWRVHILHQVNELVNLLELRELAE
jgi:hypothetical protein